MTLDYPIAERVLDNGLHVIVSTDRATPTVAVNLWYAVGSRHEQAGGTGFAHLFEHLMFAGSGQVRSGEHIAVMQAAGASVNATTWFDRTNYFEALPSGGLELALWLEADRMGSLLAAVNQQALDTQREVVKEEKRQRYDNVPYGDVMERLLRLTFPEGHPYHHPTIGSMADLDAASLEDVHAFFRQHYLPNNAVLTLVGDIEPDDGFRLAERYFGSVPSGQRPDRGLADPLPPLQDLPDEEVSADVPADAVYLTWRVPALDRPTFDAADLALAVLGDGQSGRLHQRLVRGAEIAEASSTSAMGLIGGTSFGYAYARCRHDVDLAQVEEALVTEVERLATDGPEPDELALAQAQYERHWLQMLSRVDSRADQLSAHHTLRGDAAMINTRIDEVRAIDLDDVARAATEWLTADRRATLRYHKETA